MKSIQIQKLKKIIELQQERLYSYSAIGLTPDENMFNRILEDIFYIANMESESPNVNMTISHGLRCQSKRERIVANAIVEMGYTPYHNVVKRGCTGDVRALPFDFGIIVDGKELLIEVDGEQHEKAVKFFGGYEKLKTVKRYDEIKNQYCLDNNIPLLRICPNMNVRHSLREFIKNCENY